MARRSKMTSPDDVSNHPANAMFEAVLGPPLSKQPDVIKVDHEGHKYKIPATMGVLFDTLLAAYEVPRNTEAWYDADIAFNHTFHQYLGAR